ncbi:MAG: type IV pilus assembly protein PilM [Desulfovibrionales bacterium]
MKIQNPFSKKNPSCGLDLGSGWAKVVRLSSGSKGVSLDSLGRMVWTSSDRDKAANAADKLSQFWRSLDLKDKVVISSMAGHAVIIKRVSFSFSSEKELADIINRESKQYIPFDIKDVYLDYQIMDKEKGDKSADVLLVASKRNVVHELEDILTRAGLGLSIMDVDAFALSNCFEFNYPEFLDEANYLIDIGTKQSIFCVFWKKQPVFFREVNIGGQQMTNAIASILDVNKQDAEKVKINGPNGIDSRQKSQVTQEIKNIFHSWGMELQRHIGFYQSTVSGAEPGKRLFLAGGGSLAPGLTASLNSSLGMEVRHIDPWKMVDKDINRFDQNFLREVGPQFAVPMGLALRSMNP